MAQLKEAGATAGCLPANEKAATVSAGALAGHNPRRDLLLGQCVQLLHAL